jgi:hypothetical protein
VRCENELEKEEPKSSWRSRREQRISGVGGFHGDSAAPCHKISEQARLSSEIFLCYIVNMHSHGRDFEADLYPSRQLIGFFP